MGQMAAGEHRGLKICKLGCIPATYRFCSQLVQLEMTKYPYLLADSDWDINMITAEHIVWNSWYSTFIFYIFEYFAIW